MPFNTATAQIRHEQHGQIRSRKGTRDTRTWLPGRGTMMGSMGMVPGECQVLVVPSWTSNLASALPKPAGSCADTLYA